ncbi:hypothetical protein A6770_29770 [Nostoc minutum NIES-26]|uniref:DNA-binding response regulator n=1 Tax=Nostoc minutum NIES-26 TaxID=1844469 RepID=A0A367QE96_9NOSO|nr:hypothetical protein A6770_29770 [Nostoc minutum NIES-26]
MLTIVIVEKEPFTLLGIKTALEQTLDIKINDEATYGEIGFQLVEQNKPNFVLVDLFLPDMSGLEFTRSIKKKTDSQVVILTNQTDEEVVNSAFSYGADSYMLKTTDIEVVQLAIKRAYFNEFLLDPKLTKRFLSTLYQKKYNKTISKDQKDNDPPNEKQIQILRLLAEGLSYEDIAEKMFIALSTVKTHVSVLYSKWNVKNRAEAIKKGSMLGYLDYASVVNEAFQGEEMEKIKSGI